VEGRRDGGVVGKKRAGLEQALAVRVAGTKGAGSEQEHAAPLAKQRRLDDADEGRTLHASSPRQQRHAGSPPENPHGVQQTQQAQHGQHTQQQQGQTSQLFEVSSPVAATKSRPSMSNVTMQGGKGADGGHGSGSGGGDSVQQQPGQDSERGVQREGLRGGRGSGGEDSVHQCKSAVSRETEAVGSITVGGQGGVMGRRGGGEEEEPSQSVSVSFAGARSRKSVSFSPAVLLPPLPTASADGRKHHNHLQQQEQQQEAQQQRQSASRQQALQTRTDAAPEAPLTSAGDAVTTGVGADVRVTRELSIAELAASRAVR
jgi:hypothetical protein